MRIDPHNMVKYKAHMPHRYMHHPTHVHICHPLHTSTYPIDISTISSTHPHHPLHLHPSLHTPIPSLPHTSTIPYTHFHYPIHTSPPSLHTPPPSPTHTSTIPYTHLHYPLHTPPLSPTHTSTIPYTHLTIPYTHLHHLPYTHLHYPIHTPPLSHTHTSTICQPACLIYRSNNYFRCPTSGPGQRPKTFRSKNVLRQIRHTLCAKSVIRFAPNPTYALRQIRHTLCATYTLRQIRHTFCAKSDLVLRQIALMSNVLVRDLPGHRTFPIDVFCTCVFIFNCLNVNDCFLFLFATIIIMLCQS